MSATSIPPSMNDPPGAPLDWNDVFADEPERRFVSYLLDTNLVIQSWRYQVGSEDFDYDRIDELYRSGQERLASDLVALHDLFAHSSERGWPIFCVAPATLREVGKSTERDRDAILRWAYELAEYDAPDDWREERISHLQAEVLHRPSHGVDSILLAEAGRLGCEALLTCDYRLHRRRDRIKRLGPIVLRPVELAERVSA
jgi:hypothetical protein